MKTQDKNCQITHQSSDVDFNIYYDFDSYSEDVQIGGIYLIGNNVDLIDIVSDEVIEDLSNDILYEVEGY